MASVGLILAILLPLVPFVFIIFSLFLNWDVNGIPWNWPILGMIPTVIRHIHRIHDRCVEILEESSCNFLFRGIWFTNMDIFLTTDPANIHYIMSTNFARYPKGPEFKDIFEILGDGILNADSDSWKNQRRLAHPLIHDPQFLQFVAKTAKKKLEQGLIPVLESVCKDGSVIDLQDLFQRFAFDFTCILVSGFDFNSLSMEFPEVPFSKAMDDAEEVIFFRHFVPKFFWELQKKLGFGQAKKMKEAWETIDQTIAKLIALKRERLQQLLELKEEDEDEDRDLITSYINNFESNDKFLRDTFLTFMIAGRDALTSALSWFFFCVSNNPIEETKIREELKTIIPPKEVQKRRIFAIEDLNKLVYLHAALSESLRLYPPVPFEHKVSLQADTLPSGHQVNPKTKIIFPIYALGRMKSIWGKDCMEFKPERWISEKGTIKHVPSHKFLVFNAGPRTCLGKAVAFTQLKMVAAAIIHNFYIEQIGHKVIPGTSIILQMKHKFKVRVTNRCS